MCRVCLPTQQKLHCFCNKDLVSQAIRICETMACETNKDLCHVSCRAMYIVLSCTTNDIITAVMDCVVSHVTRKCCDCVAHESEVWIWLHRCNSHDNGLC